MKALSAMYVVQIEDEDIEEVRQRNGGDSRENREIVKALALNFILDAHRPFVACKLNFLDITQENKFYLAKIGVQNEQRS